MTRWHCWRPLVTPHEVSKRSPSYAAAPAAAVAAMERVILVAVLLLLSHETCVLAAPPGRPKGSKNPSGSRKPGPENQAEKRRKLAAAQKQMNQWTSMGFSSDDVGGGVSSLREPPAGKGPGPAPDEPTGGKNSADGGRGDGSNGGASGGASAVSHEGPHSGDANLSQVVPSVVSAQDRFVSEIKQKISLAAPRHKLVTKYPYDSLWVHPPDPTMPKTSNVGDHNLRSVFVWIPELTHPQSLPDGRPPCPRCKTTHRVIIKGWTQKLSRRAIMRDACCDLLGYFYKCPNSARRTTRISLRAAVRG